MARVPQNDTVPAETPPPEPELEQEVSDRQGSSKATSHEREQWDELELKDAGERSVYRMSSLGGDLTQLVAGAMQVAQALPPAWLAKYLNEGTAAEPEILEMFFTAHAQRAATYPELAKLARQDVIAGYNFDIDPVFGTGGPQVWLEIGKHALVRGHADAITCINPDRSEQRDFAVVEAKKFRPTLWDIWKKHHSFDADPVLEKYGWQVSALHWATGLPVYFVVAQFDPNEKALTGVIDVTVWGTGTKYPVPHTRGEIAGRVMKAQKYVNSGEIPPCELADAACPWRDTDHCLGKPEKSYEDLDDPELGRLLGLYYAYSVDMERTEEQKEAERLRKDVKAEIDKHIANKGLKRTADGESGLVHVWDEAGNEYEFEWVTYPITERKATTGNKVNVKLVIEGTATDAEDHPE